MYDEKYKNNPLLFVKKMTAASFLALLLFFVGILLISSPLSDTGFGKVFVKLAYFLILSLPFLGFICAFIGSISIMIAYLRPSPEDSSTSNSHVENVTSTVIWLSISLILNGVILAFGIVFHFFLRHLGAGPP